MNTIMIIRRKVSILLFFLLPLHICVAQQNFTDKWKNEVVATLKQFNDISLKIITSSTIRGKIINEITVDTLLQTTDSVEVYFEQINGKVSFLGVKTDHFLSISTIDSNTTIHFDKGWIGINSITNMYGDYLDNAYVVKPLHFISDLVGRGRYWAKIDTVLYTNNHVIYQWIDSNTRVNDIQMIELVQAFINSKTNLIEKIITERKNNTLAELGLGAIFREIIFDFKKNTDIKSNFEIDNRYSSFIKIRNGFPWLSTPQKIKQISIRDSLLENWQASDFILTDNVLNCQLVTFSGNHTQLKQCNGWLLLDLWFKNCRPCLDFMQVVNNNYGEITNRNITLISLNPTKDRPDSHTKALLEKLNIKNLESLFFALNYSEKLANTFQIFPSIYLINPTKEVVYKKYGFQNESDFFRMLKDIDLIINNH